MVFIFSHLPFELKAFVDQMVNYVVSKYQQIAPFLELDPLEE